MRPFVIATVLLLAPAVLAGPPVARVAARHHVRRACKCGADVAGQCLQCPPVYVP
jgi:hypothetical protein